MVGLYKDKILNKGNALFFSTDNVSVGFKSGFPVISFPLPSRREQCEFVLRPLTHTVKDLLENIQQEDKGIERAMVYNVDGSRISGSTGVDVLLQSDFKVVLNDNSYFVSVPDESKCYWDTIRIMVIIIILQKYWFSPPLH